MPREEIETLETSHVRFVLLGALAVAAPFILWNAFLRDLLVLFVIFSILALSLNIVIGYMGQFCFGHQAFFGLGAYTTALLSIHTGVSPWLGVLAGVAVAGGLGCIIGLVALRAMRGLYLAIVTYGIGVIMWLIFLNEYTITGGPRGLYGIARLAVPGLVFSTEISLYFLALAFLVFTVYFLTRWERSRFGRAVIAIRENEELARSIGINSYIYYVMAFTLATAVAGLAGCLYAHYLTIVNPYLFSTYYLFAMIIMVIVGGTGTLGGPILGSFIFTFGLRLLPTTKEIDLVIFGGILLAIIITMPRGAYPYLESLFTRLTARRKQPEVGASG